MLPFLKKNKEASVSVSAMPDVIVRESDHEEEHHDDMLHAIGQELIDALHKKDVGSVIECLRAAFYILDAEPHEEGEHLEHEEMEE